MTPDENRPVDVPNLTPEQIKTLVQSIQTRIGATDAADAAALTQPWWTSRTIWGAIVVIIAQVAMLFGVSIDANGMTEAALALATLIGAIVAWWGRVNAGRPISVTKILPGIELIR
jgi:hypothetical protein